MPVLKAYAFPHPPLAVASVGRGEEIKIQKTLVAFDEAAKEIAELAPETIVFVTPHNVLYGDYFHISPGEKARGNLSRFNAPDTRFEAAYDTKLADEIVGIAETGKIPAGYLGEKDKSLDHGATVPMWFINRRCENYKMIRISQSGLDAEAHYRLGQCICRAAEKTGRRVVLAASGDLSHKLPGSSYGTVPEGAEFDKKIAEIFDSADFFGLFEISDELREKAGECGYNSFMVIAGCFDRRKVESKLYSYEGPFGVGYGVAGFAPGECDESRNMLEKYQATVLMQAREKQESEDRHRLLARQSLEYTVKSGKKLVMPENLPEELKNSKAGVFVSLHKNGKLRGCIGTIAPTTENVALEIIQNAVSAGLSDNRFEPVSAEELPYLTYKVDVLMPPEPIEGPKELDAKRYGVIVSSGYKRGLLLPNLDGVETAEKQISIARKKGGIPEGAKITLERFEVVRHE
ncbi:MAG: AmmeMemoRadiSam system protein A [Oscillospiraceae bacterium]|nr:AmmeMemoRadiSam system protein A [Oscillospiraceae bacterium]